MVFPEEAALIIWFISALWMRTNPAGLRYVNRLFVSIPFVSPQKQLATERAEEMWFWSKQTIVVVRHTEWLTPSFSALPRRRATNRCVACSRSDASNRSDTSCDRVTIKVIFSPAFDERRDFQFPLNSKSDSTSTLLAVLRLASSFEYNPT